MDYADGRTRIGRFDRRVSMKILKISNIAPKAIQIDLDNGEWAQMWQFGHSIYTSVSDGFRKSNLASIKKDVELFNWNSQELEKLYI